ncbi:peptidoglycan-binding protein [Kitasatospora sp. NPDC048286]|uniref:peptidoglycan-binding protein n=1 Tax=Kitasatospora sp. NPDC048286 TaxID=3364047 RepID=UPI003711E024
MDGNGWADIGYSLAVCQHGYVYEGRGKNAQNSANGNPQLNRDHYAVLAFVGSSIITEPSSVQIAGIQDAIAYLRRHGAGNEVRGHRDGYATECPGGPLYRLVQAGTLDPGTLYDGGIHTVQVGDSLESVSLKYNIPKMYIIAVNNLQAPYALMVGQKLKVPARGVNLGEGVPEGGDGGGETPTPTGYTPFPGTEWFMSNPNSPIVTAMGQRLVEEGCGKYTSGPGPQWSETDRASYQAWQEKLGYSGTNADGWPGKGSWDKLLVPKS